MTLKETVAAAKAAGMSYGEYVKRENERKAARLGMSYDDVVTGRGEDRRCKTARQAKEYWTPKQRRGKKIIVTEDNGRQVIYPGIRTAHLGTGISQDTIWKIIHGERGAWIKGYTFRLAETAEEEQE